MPLGHHADAKERAQTLSQLRHAWPPSGPDETRGYRPLDLQDTRPLAALDLTEGVAVVVVERRDRQPTALPCRRTESGWRIARPGDGSAAALVERLDDRSPVELGGFALHRYSGAHLVEGPERELGTDQSNISFVVGDTAIVKWRSSVDADGRRATRLRRHLQANGFLRSPALLASLTWTDDAGEAWVLADVDAYLPQAEDGWDHGIAHLLRDLERGGAPPSSGYAAALGTLTAELHAALLQPSAIVPRPTRTAGPREMLAVRDAGLGLLQRALAIDAADQPEVLARESHLRSAVERLPTDGGRLGLIHGDLHIGQLVPWRDGLDVIDFDGPPEPTAPPGDENAPARDVAQMICSAWSLAAVVDQRTGGVHHTRLAAWGRLAERSLFEAYTRTLADLGVGGFDRRFLEPFIAEQLCRELLYAEATLPRWRYAPLQALRWRYPLRPDDDD